MDIFRLIAFGLPSAMALAGRQAKLPKYIAVCISAGFFLLCGCSAKKLGNVQNVDVRPAGPNSAVVVSSKKYSLGRALNPKKEQAFQDRVMISADSARKKITGSAGIPDIGFNYTITPKGVVYPFSEVEIECVVQSRYAGRYGADLCSAMFDMIDAKFPAQ